MRRTCGIGIMLLALAGCQSLPASMRIEADGSTLTFEKKAEAPVPPARPEGGDDAPDG